jgi:hypothetical protein
MLEKHGLVHTNAKSIKINDRFGKLTVLAFGQKPGTYLYYAVCQCQCGSDPKSIRMDGLKSGSVVSCGCARKTLKTTHGLSKSRHYGRWQNMMDRCYNPKCKAFPDYGERGIKVCIEWHKVDGFVADLPSGYFKGAEIDRINNDGNYEPGNVRWATRQVNTRNRRSNRMLTHDGRTQTMAAWSAETGIPSSMLFARLNKLGWSLEKALTEPRLSDPHERMKRAHDVRWVSHVYTPKPMKRVLKRYLFRGEMATIREMSTATGIPTALLRKRICERGWEVEKATQVI